MLKSPLKFITQDMRSLEPFPQVASTILTMSGQTGVQPSDLIEVIQTDPTITSKVLKLCNSAYYGFEREIGSLKEAGNMLGADTLVNLVLTSSAHRYFKRGADSSSASLDALWNRSIEQALASRLIAECNQYDNPERAYTAGLMQNIGEIVLDRFYASEFNRVRAEVLCGRSPLQAERAVLGITHSEVGARLVSEWKLPYFLVDTIRFHHAPEQATVDPTLTSIVHLAETMLDQTGEADMRVPHDVCEAAFELTGLGRSDFESIHTRLDADMQRAKELIAV